MEGTAKRRLVTRSDFDGLVCAMILKQKVMTTCSNTERGPLVLKACKAGCIGCLRCQRECPADAIVVKDNLARIDMSKCVQCGHCADICTSHVISYFGPEYKNR